MFSFYLLWKKRQTVKYGEIVHSHSTYISIISSQTCNTLMWTVQSFTLLTLTYFSRLIWGVSPLGKLPIRACHSVLAAPTVAFLPQAIATPSVAPYLKYSRRSVKVCSMNEWTNKWKNLATWGGGWVPECIRLHSKYSGRFVCTDTEACPWYTL